MHTASSPEQISASKCAKKVPFKAREILSAIYGSSHCARFPWIVDDHDFRTHRNGIRALQLRAKSSGVSMRGSRSQKFLIGFFGSGTFSSARCGLSAFLNPARTDGIIADIFCSPPFQHIRHFDRANRRRQ